MKVQTKIGHFMRLGVSLDARDGLCADRNLASLISDLFKFLRSTFHRDLRPRRPKLEFHTPRIEQPEPSEDRSRKQVRSGPGLSHSDQRLSSPAESYSVWFRELYSRELQTGGLGNGQDPLMKALIELHPGDLDLIVMRHVEQMDTREMAIRLQTDEAEVKRRLLRALLLLRNLKDQSRSALDNPR